MLVLKNIADLTAEMEIKLWKLTVCTYCSFISLNNLALAHMHKNLCGLFWVQAVD